MRSRPTRGRHGTPSAKVLLTNLHNRTQPLTRYELTDHFTRHPADGDPYLHATVEGRADEAFRYGTVTVDALMIRTAMVKAPQVAEYQVRQTGNGIDVAVIAGGALDREALAASLERVLRGAGVPGPPRARAPSHRYPPALPRAARPAGSYPVNPAPQ